MQATQPLQTLQQRGKRSAGEDDEREGPDSEQPEDGEQGDEAKHEDTEEDAHTTLQEGRIVLPGIQTLFGFQLTAVFNAPFSQKLSAFDQGLHVASMLLIVASIALVMTPAPYHRQVEPGIVSRRANRIATRLFTASLVPLMLGICLDLYVITHFLFGRLAVSLACAGGVLALLLGLWFVFPQAEAARRRARCRRRQQGA